jgi:hypothetical protein
VAENPDRTYRLPRHFLAGGTLTSDRPIAALVEG